MACKTVQNRIKAPEKCPDCEEAHKEEIKRNKALMTMIYHGTGEPTATKILRELS
jgi:hypothetical protein